MRHSSKRRFLDTHELAVKNNGTHELTLLAVILNEESKGTPHEALADEVGRGGVADELFQSRAGLGCNAETDGQNALVESRVSCLDLQVIN